METSWLDGEAKATVQGRPRTSENLLSNPARTRGLAACAVSLHSDEQGYAVTFAYLGGGDAESNVDPGEGRCRARLRLEADTPSDTVRRPLLGGNDACHRRARERWERLERV